MLNRNPEPMSVAAFFAWQERQGERYELVGGVPVRMMAGARNVHDGVAFPARPRLVQDAPPGGPAA